MNVGRKKCLDELETHSGIRLVTTSSPSASSASLLRNLFFGRLPTQIIFLERIYLGMHVQSARPGVGGVSNQHLDSVAEGGGEPKKHSGCFDCAECPILGSRKID